MVPCGSLVAADFLDHTGTRFIGDIFYGADFLTCANFYGRIPVKCLPGNDYPRSVDRTNQWGGISDSWCRASGRIGFLGDCCRSDVAGFAQVQTGRVVVGVKIINRIFVPLYLII